MDFIDFSQLKVVDINRFSTLRLEFNADTYLDATMEKGAEYIASLLKVNYKSSAVFYSISINGKMTEDDFIYLCETLSASILRHNTYIDKRDTQELSKILNILPKNKWMLKKQFTSRINSDMTTLLNCAYHLYRNRYVNINIDTADGEFKYQLIGPEIKDENINIESN